MLKRENHLKGFFILSSILIPFIMFYVCISQIMAVRLCPLLHRRFELCNPQMSKLQTIFGSIQRWYVKKGMEQKGKCHEKYPKIYCKCHVIQAIGVPFIRQDEYEYNPTVAIWLYNKYCKNIF